MRGARRASGPDGELIPLDKQDRSLWDREQIAEGVALISDALSQGSVGAVSTAGGHCRRARRSGSSRGHRLAADSGALHRAQRAVGQPDGRRSITRSPRRWCDGPAAGLRAAAGPRRGWTTEESPSPARGARASAGDGRRSRGGDRALPAAAGRTTSIPERNYLVAQAGRLRGQCDDRKRQFRASLRTPCVPRTARSSARRRREARSD